MKVRSGFVSNSSSSSFCIYGAEMDLDVLVEKLKESNLFSEEELDEFAEDGWYDVDSAINEKMETNLEFYMSEDYVWIGRSWSSIDDDETGGEFKLSTKKELEKLLGPDVDCSTHEEEIYN